jgi:hypothetical protein
LGIRDEGVGRRDSGNPGATLSTGPLNGRGRGASALRCRGDSRSGPSNQADGEVCKPCREGQDWYGAATLRLRSGQAGGRPYDGQIQV